jgi:hypothetical protein
MAQSYYGCGTCFVPSRSIVRWRRSWFVPHDYDGLECFCLFLMPIVPLRAIHAFDWTMASREWDWRTGERDDTDFCQSLPIRWDADLVLRAYVRRWAGAAAWFGAMFGGALFYGLVAQRVTLAEALGEFCCFSFVGILAGSVLGLTWLTDQRRRDICRILGPAEEYGGDPATWTDERLDDFGPASSSFGTATFAEAVPRLLEGRDLARAMLAARLSLMRDPPGAASSDSATDLVLRSDELRQALAIVRSDPTAWYREMNRGTTNG